MSDTERRGSYDKRVRAGLCLFPGCDRATPARRPRWTMCDRHHSAGGSVVNYWRIRRLQKARP